jgi:hypothetical protein
MTGSTRRPPSRGGRRIDGVDRILLATGYLYTLPFLPPSSVEPGDHQLLRAGRGLGGLDARARLFSAADPSLALLAAHQRVVPFPLAEAQACLLARAWAGRLPATAPPPPPPSPGDGCASAPREGAALAETGADEEEDRRALLLGYPRDCQYMDSLLRWAATAAPGAGGRAGKAVPPGWGPRESWIRETLPAIRRAWMQRGEGRFRVHTVEELGFVFEDGDEEAAT